MNPNDEKGTLPGAGSGGGAADQGHCDPLTGLPNRQRVLARIADLRERQPDFAVLLFDLDQFRRINESLGRALADQVLVGFAARLQSRFRSADLISRVGPDEFVAIIPGTREPGMADWIVERVQDLLSQLLAAGAKEVLVTASLGIALGSMAGSAEEVVQHAETALANARELGRAGLAFYVGAMQRWAAARLELETDLRLALDREELSVHYQPIINLQSGRICGFEALARWRHPARGPVSPAEFIPVAEETGLIVPLGSWVLRSAARQLAAWRTRFADGEPLWMSVNVSEKQLDAAFARAVAQALEETGLPAHGLRLELTESTLMRNSEVSRTLTRLKELGVRLTVDDFGTGYSSLSKLDSLPIESIKVDRSFISRLDPGGVRPEIAAAIISLGHLLGVEVVAEGIETATQLAQTRQLGCHFGQGFFFSHPVTAGEAESLLAHGASSPQRG
jgi:diguanylate cyclase (GGDEF)-like protein